MDSDAKGLWVRDPTSPMKEFLRRLLRPAFLGWVAWRIMGSFTGSWARARLRGSVGRAAMRTALLAFCVVSAGYPGRAHAQTATALAPVDDTVGVILGGDGRVYGTNNDAVSGNATVFSMNADGSGFASVYTVTGATLYGLVQGGDGRLYGVASQGSQSELFALTTDGATFSVLHTFPWGLGGAVPTQVPLIIGNDGRLYGTTLDSMDGGIMTVFATNTDGTGFTTLYTFPNYGTAAYPFGVIQGSDGRLYGTTLGGMDGTTSGTVFALNTDGTGYTELYVFENADLPFNGVIQGSDGRLYGIFMGSVGSTIGQFMYALNTDGTGFTTPMLLDIPDGDQCVANLLQGRDGLLYGMASATPLLTAFDASGANAEGQGYMFSVARDGSDFATLCPVPAGYFNSGLVQDGSGRLYGSSSTEVYRFLAPLTTSLTAPTTVVAGGTLTLAEGPPAAGYSYQWLYEGADIAGATSTQLTVPAIGTAQAGYYTLLTTSPNATESATTTHVSITSNAWLANLSSRMLVAPAQSADDILIAGFVTSGTSGKQLLLRGIGPSLATVGVSSGLLADPELTLYSGQSVLAGPFSSWASSLSTLFTQLGAFPLPGGSADAATSMSVSPGAYTAELTSTNGRDGIGMVEIYDADHGAPPNRLVNLSVRGYVGTGANVLIGGFVIAGSSSETVLIRAIGPGLMQYMANIEGLLWDPVLTVFDSSGKTVATITGWSQLPQVGNSTVAAGFQAATNAAMESAGAFAIAPGADSAMVLTLPPGDYTAQVSSASGATGIALFEVYEVPGNSD